MTKKLKIVIRRETAEPTETVLCDMRENDLPWIFKANVEACEKKAKLANKQHSKGTDWLPDYAEFVIKHTAYSPYPETVFGYDNLRFGEAVEMAVDALREEFKIASTRITQKNLLGK